MENKYRILGTLSDDEATVKKMSTRLNTKKLKNHFFCARVEQTDISSSLTHSGCTSAASSTPSCTQWEDTNTISRKSQIPPVKTDQLSQWETEQESWFVKTLEEYYNKLNLSEFTSQNVQEEIYKNYWGNPFSEGQVAHISSLNDQCYSGSNIPQPTGWGGEPSNDWSRPAEDVCFDSAPGSAQGSPDIPVFPDRHAGHRIRQTAQGLNTVQNLSPHKLRKIVCWIETGQFGMISEIGGDFGLQKPVLYPTQKSYHTFSPKIYDLSPEISGYILITTFVKENQSAYISFANISGKEMVVTIDSGCTTSVATSAFIKNIFPNFHKLLKNYNGKPFVTADNNVLKTMGMITVKICLGKLLFDMDLVIYQGDHAECLVGLDILKERFNLLISPSGIYMKIEDLARHNELQKVSRIGTQKNQQIVVSVKQQVSIHPREQKLIWVCIQQKDIQGLSLDDLISDPWVCHSEDIDNLIMDERNMHVWYSLIELQKNYL